MEYNKRASQTPSPTKSFGLSPEPTVIIKKSQRLLISQQEFIAQLAIKAISKASTLPDICKVVSVSLNKAYGEDQNWICIASEDPKMCGYVYQCKAYVQFALGPYYFLVASISIH